MYPDEWDLCPHLSVVVSPSDELFIPDIAVISRDDMPPGSTVPSDLLLLAVEITSRSNAKTDRTTKCAGFAAGGVPLYLLIDRFADIGPSVVLYSDLDGGFYQNVHRVPFGKPLEMPEPFSFLLNTKEF